MPFTPRTATRRTLIVLALAMLLAVQWLGALHRVLHPHGAAHEAAHALFADHDQASDCQLFDDLAAGDLAVGALVLAGADLGTERPVSIHPGWHLAAQAAGFLARGPPSRS